ncbi:L-serine ammonia-lyase [Anaeromyxobacter diazotrophicus]|uniref:L-serine dehydratase n=1 Tax=Anaeromyxobacter diazotrophicus TaxID=2590199 RepID=A0A7I9VQA6_9BACT|nr:L-serine ammonia-lyase [Anaeromyxobacter diazotrophicus]GEJ58593.1 L-serine dehydratase [Anaeromyxobacter diazotrophicus]
MPASVFDLFKIGIGPSSSHTVGPMRAARAFAQALDDAGLLGRAAAVRVELFGSLGATGRGHGTDKAVLLGLMGEAPESVDVATLAARVAAARAAGGLALLGRQPVRLRPAEDLHFERKVLPYHPNALRFTAEGAAGEVLAARVYYSVGGGFVVDEETARAGAAAPPPAVPHPFHTAAELLLRCRETGLPISGVMFENERALRPEAEVRAGLTRLWEAMQGCVRRGCETEGVLPGGLKVARRAPRLARELRTQRADGDPLAALDWVTLWALAVNEENAAGGRVVTAPTNGAAGIVPAVMHYHRRLVPGATDEDLHRFLLAAGAIGALYKENASISGAEVGCQGEVGSACSMAAGALCEVLGGTPEQAENAAEIAMEHNLGLTCDPVGGLVQIPCIERNATAAVKAIHAARMALHGDGRHFVSLDQVIRTMRETGADMKSKYKETARGGLALSAAPAGDLSVGLPEC